MNLLIQPQHPTEAAGEYAYRLLRKNIVEAHLAPGECISPAEVAELLHISRTPIQAAFSRLMADGLLNIFPQRGSYVSQIDMKRLQQSVFMRNLMDQSVMRQLCRMDVPEEGLMELESNLNQQSFCFERKMAVEVFELDNQFHDLLYALAGMEHMQQGLLSISADQQRVRLLKLLARMRWGQTVEEHAQLIGAIREKDAKLGQRLSYEHISRIAWDLEAVHETHPDYFYNWDNYPPQPINYQFEGYYNMYLAKPEGEDLK